MLKGYLAGVRIVAVGAALTFIPLTIAIGDGFYPQAKAASANAGGNGKGGDNGNAGGNGNGNGGASANAGGNGKGQSDATDGEVSVASNGQEKSALHPSNLGRLNAFLNASSAALKNAAPDSAIGIVSAQYAGALSSYIDGVTQGTLPAPTLDDAAAILAKAANKPLSPEIVAAINERLAEENPDNPNLAGLSDPVNQAANDQLAQDLSDLANTAQETETSQGLGPIY